jgi:hypothetical protein
VVGQLLALQEPHQVVSTCPDNTWATVRATAAPRWTPNSTVSRTRLGMSRRRSSRLPPWAWHSPPQHLPLPIALAALTLALPHAKQNEQENKEKWTNKYGKRKLAGHPAVRGHQLITNGLHLLLRRLECGFGGL